MRIIVKRTCVEHKSLSGFPGPLSRILSALSSFIAGGRRVGFPGQSLSLFHAPRCTTIFSPSPSVSREPPLCRRRRRFFFRFYSPCPGRTRPFRRFRACPCWLPGSCLARFQPTMSLPPSRGSRFSRRTWPVRIDRHRCSRESTVKAKSRHTETWGLANRTNILRVIKN